MQILKHFQVNKIIQFFLDKEKKTFCWDKVKVF